MIGKGSVSHNSRTFIAENVDAVRTKNNVVFCSDNIKQVYHDLFDAALQQYNEKQVRNDRKILDYYEKIRTGKQEKLFHEVIFQIGNKDDMNARDENGELAKTILTDFMGKFQERNSNLRVFSAHLHMDEETPHLHIDFIPFTTGSKRGLETRVSLKKALEQQGFVGSSRRETEWSKWVDSEKQQLSHVMERYEVQRKELGTHKPHLSVLNYKKQEREKEVADLEKEAQKIENQILELKEDQEFINEEIDKYDKNEEWQIPQPQPMMKAKSYKEKIIEPFIEKLKVFVKNLSIAYRELQRDYLSLEEQLKIKSNTLFKVERVNRKLIKEFKNYDKVKRTLGKEKIDDILNSKKARNNERQKKSRGFDLER